MLDWRKVATFAVVEAALLVTGVIVDALTENVPLWFWIVLLTACVASLPLIWMWPIKLSRLLDTVFPARKLRRDIERLEYESTLNSAKNLLLKLDLEEHVEKSKDE